MAALTGSVLLDSSAANGKVTAVGRALRLALLSPSSPASAVTIARQSLHNQKGEYSCRLAQIGSAITSALLGTCFERDLLFKPMRRASSAASPSWQ